MSDSTSADDGTPAAPESGGISRDLPLKRHRTGWILTGAYLLLVAIYVIVCRDAVLKMAPNEAGDLLAGVFAPLAFLWLVLGFFQQGDELRNSAEALWLQGEELRKSVEQQREMVKVSKEQLEFEKEQFLAQAAEARRRAQPNFTFVGGGWGAAGDITVMHFKLLNRGPSCTDVRLHVSDTEVKQRSFFKTGDELDFDVHVGPNHPLGNRDFKIEYVDALGNPGEDVLVLEATYSYGRMILELPD